MRTLILLIVCVFTVNTLTAQQNDLAFLDSNTKETKKILTRNYKATIKESNSIYLKERAAIQFSNVIKQWRKKLANYNLKSNSIYNNSERATYRIVFNNKQVNITADYDSNGNILNTYETYKNIKIPFHLRLKIIKTNPKSILIKNTYYLAYCKTKGIYKQYFLVDIDNGNESKTLKFDENFNLI